MIEWFTSNSSLVPVFNFCFQAKNDKRPAAVNMDAMDWQHKPHTLLNHLFKQKTYDTGGYSLLTRNNKTVAGSGYYQTDLSEHVYVCASRAYTVRGVKDGYTYLQGELWHAQLDKIREAQGKIAIGSFNDYNKHFIDTLVAINNPDNWKTSFQENGLWYRKPGKRIQPIKALPFSVNYQYTEQWLVYAVFDPEYEMEFLDIMRSIKYKT